MADWREFYKATVLETNPRELERLIKKTEQAILIRLQELDRSSDDAGERHEIAEASGGVAQFEDRKIRLA